MNNSLPQDDGRFATEGRIDAEFYEKNKRFLLPWGRHAVAAAAIMAIYAVLALLYEDGSFIAWGALYALAISGLYFVQRWRAVKALSARLREAVPEGCCLMRTSFGEDGIRIANKTTGSSLVLSYDKLRKMAETDAYLLLVSKARQMAVVYRECLSKDKYEELCSFLESKCPGIKVYR